ncbi:putative cyclic nucleotide-gated ion channel 20 [Arachis hypogaea]|nr:putative cyclic nucleotide-gated ion channel 20 [Arachis hypogaea]
MNEEILMENLPEDHQRDIRCFKFSKKVRIFAFMDEPILDSICEKIRHKTYIKGSRILNHGGIIYRENGLCCSREIGERWGR